MFPKAAAKGMVSPSKPPNSSRVASHQQSPKCKLVKGPQPLVNHHFYLDIEKHHVSSRIEQKIKELGGSIDFFLDKKVTHFVTDKAPNPAADPNRSNRQSANVPSPLIANNQQQTPKTPKTPLTPYTPLNFCDSPNVSHAANESKDQAPKHRSRADAMLQRARLTQQTCDSSSTKPAQKTHSHSPIQLAKSWGTPIWTPEYTLKFLEKVAASIVDSLLNSSSHRHDAKGAHTPHSAHAAARSANPRRLRGEYIKIEAQGRHYRPFYREFKYWPTINLSNPIGFCPFAFEPPTHVPPPADKPKEQPAEAPPPIESPTISNHTMTRKSRSKANRSATIATASATAKTNKTAIKSEHNKCGYCEICRIEYETLADHLQTKEHQNFVKNGDNFLALDSLINNSANVQSFLNVNRVDDTLFGKRTAGKKVGKLFRATSEIKRETSDEHLPAYENRVNGASNGLPMKTRRSNSKRSENVRKAAKSSPVPKQEEEEEEENDDEEEDDEEEDNEPVEDMDVDEDNDEPDNAHSVDYSHSSRSHKLRSRRESAKRINYAETREDDENTTSLAHTSKKIQKIRLRSVRWRPPSNEDRSGMSQPFYKVVEESENKSTRGANRKDTNNDSNRASSVLGAGAIEDGVAGSLKLRVCRVRESELSLLTNEADKFMFPRLSSEPATDDDRQSTSDPADISVDISSEIDVYRPNSSQRQRSHESLRSSSTTTRELDCSNKKKRRNQLEAFLNDNSEYYKFDNPDSRLRFHEAPFQPTLTRADGHQQRSSTTATTTTTNRSSSSSTDQYSSGRTPHGPALTKMCSSTASTSSSSSPWTSPSSRHTQPLVSRQHETPAAQESEDRKGASYGNQSPTSPLPPVPVTHDQAHLLRTDVVKMHKFAFERVPSSEPWFEAFQRQDECRERIYEYWGSTAYRKLPFELGPLPPHSPDCCRLAHIQPTKRPGPSRTNQRKPKSKRSQILRATKSSIASNNPSSSSQPASGASSPVAEPPPSPTIDPAQELRIQKRLLMLQKNLRTNALPALHNPKPPAAVRSQSLEKMMHKRKLPSQVSEERSHESSVEPAAEPKNKLANTGVAQKKNAFLLDINGRPRKSPREHASTLAILSCLVQQKRKREKELNGGISPEKKRCTTDADVCSPSEDDDDHSDTMDTNRRPAAETDEDTSLDSCAMQSVKVECDSETEPVESPPTPTEVDEDNNSNSTTYSTRRSATTPSKPSTPTRKKDSGTLDKMPACDYISPHLVCRQLDEMFSVNDDYENADKFFHDSSGIPFVSVSDPDDLVLVGTPKDFVDIISTVAEGPLRYRSNLTKSSGLSSFSRRKRKNNKTGWPSVPRRRMPLAVHSEGAAKVDEPAAASLADAEDDSTCSTSLEDEDSKPVPTSPDRSPIDITQRLQSSEYSISRGDEQTGADESFHGKFTEFDTDGGRASVEFTSSSDKAENSDIFTVSSDSVDTADMTTLMPNTTSSGIASGSTNTHNHGSTTAADPDGCPSTSANHAGSSMSGVPMSDESSSVDETLAELLQNRLAERAVAHPEEAVKATNRKRGRSASIGKTSQQRRLAEGMQPIIRVKKMSHKMLMNAAAQRRRSRVYDAAEQLLPERRGNETPPPDVSSRTDAAAAGAGESPIVTITGSGRKSIARNSCSPKTKFSPPKLRKPRGRWYRER